MAAIQPRKGRERGIVLYGAVLILSLLIVLGLGARFMLQNDYRILANLRGSTEAFYLADAGVEWAKQEIAKTVTHPPAPANHSQTFSSGMFQIVFLSPVAVTPLVATIDLRATGTVGKSTQTIRAQVTKSYDLADGAIALRGNAGQVTFTGNTFVVSGMDHDPASGDVVPDSQPRRAISVSDDALRKLVEASLESASPSQITGGGDLSAIAQSDFLQAQSIAGLAAELCSADQALSTLVPPGGTLSLENQTWGSRTAPQLRCIEGLPGPGDSIQLAGDVNGAGILVVRNAQLIAQGAFRWEGLVIVTGSNVGFTAVGAESKEILGSLMVNETGSPGTGVNILDIQGTLRLLFSRAALRSAAGLVPASTMANIYGSIPFSITQNYWQTLNP